MGMIQRKQTIRFLDHFLIMLDVPQSEFLDIAHDHNNSSVAAFQHIYLALQGIGYWRVLTPHGTTVKHGERWRHISPTTLAQSNKKFGSNSLNFGSKFLSQRLCQGSMFGQWLIKGCGLYNVVWSLSLGLLGLLLIIPCTAIYP
ncbi:unnamed protein product [Arabidopsis thaliana]|uniref:Uncharacterized protein n=1 Tax=Arabidopsis thaliana TaxID=3702 RepID=A0A654G4Z0_ARATH|nr:unnamed protein product [Arabidopsis thaliana]